MLGYAYPDTTYETIDPAGAIEAARRVKLQNSRISTRLSRWPFTRCIAAILGNLKKASAIRLRMFFHPVLSYLIRNLPEIVSGHREIDKGPPPHADQFRQS